MRPARLLVLACIVASAAACDNSGDPATTPTAPALLITESFSGTVDPTGSDFRMFTVGSPGGEVDVTLTAAGPPATIFMGLGVGTPAADSSSCTLDTRFSVAVPASTTPQIGPLNAGPGTYCFKVFDVGNQTATINYTVTVAHP